MIVTYTRANTKPGDVRAIQITPEYKIRQFDRGTYGQWDREWILYRRAVPNLSDTEWYGCPSGDGWTRREEQ